MAAITKKRQKPAFLFWGTVDSSGWPKDFWEQMDKADVRKERIMEQKAKSTSPSEAVQKLPWLRVQKAIHDSNAREGYRLFMRQKVTIESGKTISGVEYEKRKAKKIDADIAETNQVIDSALCTPEMLLVGNQKTTEKKIRKAQQRNEFMNAALRVGLLFQKFSPEERQELRGVLESNGAVDWYTQGAALDAAVLEAHPDPIERDDALAGAEVIYRRLDSGLDIDGAFRAKNLYLDNRTRSRENMGAVHVTVEAVQKALVASGGSKSGAARTLGISRAKMRRLTGERM